jgi:hypothetical protein
MIAPSNSTKEPHDPLKGWILVKRGDPNALNILDQLDEYEPVRELVGSESEPTKQANDGQNGSQTGSQSNGAPKPNDGKLTQLSRVAKVETPAEPVPFQQWRDSMRRTSLHWQVQRKYVQA